MKKILAVFLGLTLIFLLAACNFSNLFDKGDTEDTTQQPPPSQPQQPQRQQPQRQQPPPPTPSQPSGGYDTPDTYTEEELPPEPVKEKKAGLGVILETDIGGGVFRVKVDKEKIFEHPIYEGKGRKPWRLERELRVPAGQHRLRFVVEDFRNGVRGRQDMNIVYNPGSHHVIKVKAMGSAKNMTIQILE